MKGKRFAWLTMLLVLILVSTSLAASCASKSPTSTAPSASSAATPVKAVTWRFQTCAVEGDYLYGTSKAVAKMIEEASGGLVKVETYPINALVALPDEFAAVKKGSIEAAIVIGSMSANEVPSNLAAEMAYVPSNVYQLYDLFNNWKFRDPIQSEYNKAGIQLINPMYGGLVYLGTTVPINTVADFKGKPFFLVGSHMFLQKLGVIQTDIPGFDYYTALKLGTVVGTTQAINFLETQKLMEVDKYYIKTADQVASGHLIINKKAWDALPPDIQNRIQDRIDANIIQALKPHVDGEARAEKAALAYGVKFTTLPPEEEAKVRAASRADWDQIAAKSPASAQAIQILKNWMQYNNIK